MCKYVCNELAQKVLNGFGCLAQRQMKYKKATFYPNVLFPWDNFRLICGRSRWKKLVINKIERINKESGWL